MIQDTEYNNRSAARLQFVRWNSSTRLLDTGSTWLRGNQHSSRQGPSLQTPASDD